MNALTLRPSRSIIANRLNRFASLYDPDGEPEIEAETDTDRHIPETVQDEAGETVSIPLELSNKRYQNYRDTRRKRNPECFYCGKPLKSNKGNSLDHITPQSRGGRDFPANVVLACSDCNREKDDRTPGEWLEEMRRQIATLTARADRLQGLIDEHGLDFFQPTMTREEARAASLQKEQESRRPKARRERFESAQSVDSEHFNEGRRLFSITERSTRRCLISHLKGSDVIHYLKAVGFETGGPLMLVGEAEWIPKIDGQFGSSEK